jgi:hypothetical protein
MPLLAGQMVRRMRELIQLIEGTNKSFRDGFTTDTDLDPDLIPLLPSLNDFITFCSIAGAKPRSRDIPVVVGQREYAGGADVADVKQVYFNGIPLFETNRASLDRHSPNWLTTAAGTPRKWFKEGDQVVLDTAPDGGTMFWRVALTLDLFDGSDAAATLDPAINDSTAPRLPYGAAYLAMNIDSLQAGHRVRLASYKEIGNGVLQEIQGSTGIDDYAHRVSLDTYVPDTDYPRLRIGLPNAPEAVTP